MTCMVMVAHASVAQTPTPGPAAQSFGFGPGFDRSNFRKAPTEITSDSLTVQSEKHLFIYTGHVVVKQADMTLLCDELEGHYTEKNEIETLIARKNVSMTKGENIKASSQKAVYTAKDAVITMTENPSLEQNGSTLASDVIKIYLNENRSEALGKVKVNLNPKTGETPAASGTPTPSPSTPTPIPGVVILGKGS